MTVSLSSYSGRDAMKMRGESILRISQVIVLVGSAFLTGCSGNTRALFTKPELIAYQRLAVLGLEPEQEQIFMACYIKTFPEKVITFIERGRLREVISEQDLLQGRLDENKRARIKKILGVEALIMCEYHSAQEGRGDRKKLRVRIVDTETGAIVGSVVTEAYVHFEDHARAATKALKADLLGGGYRGYWSDTDRSGSSPAPMM
jgi:hypothetical protein